MTASATGAASYRAPSRVALTKIATLLAESVETGSERIRISTELALALTRYAMAHGAVTVGDLDKELAG
jgi:hypothetical protein